MGAAKFMALPGNDRPISCTGCSLLNSGQNKLQPCRSDQGTGNLNSHSKIRGLFDSLHRALQLRH